MGDGEATLLTPGLCLEYWSPSSVLQVPRPRRTPPAVALVTLT